MLSILLPAIETYSEEIGFEVKNEMKIRLEHSLYSISLWESKWKKSFFHNDGMSPSEFLYYITCMPISDDLPDQWWTRLTQKHIIQVRNYMVDPMTATTINNRCNRPGKKTIITSELVYFWMSQFNIPFECDRWNFNRLMTLLEVASIKNSPKQKMDRKTAISQQKAICEARRKQYGSKG